MGAFRARFVLPPLLVPVPLRATVRVGLVALLDTVTFPEAAPAAVGVNVTLTVQDAPAAIEAPQVLVDANGPVAEPEDTLALQPEVVRGRDRWRELVPPPALTVGVPVRLPVAVGVNFTLTVHEPFAAIEDPHVLVRVNFTLTVPEPFAAIADTP